MSELLSALRSGDLSARDKVIAEHLDLSALVARRMSKYSRNYADDLVSESYLGLVYAVDSAAHKLLDDDLERYIAGWCRQFVMSFLYRNHLVRIPSSTSSRYKKIGKQLQPANVHELNGHTPTVVGFENLVDFQEMLSRSVSSLEEKGVIELRIQGFRDKEIAHKISKSTSYVNKLRVAVRNRFDKLESEISTSN